MVTKGKWLATESRHKWDAYEKAVKANVKAHQDISLSQENADKAADKAFDALIEGLIVTTLPSKLDSGK